MKRRGIRGEPGAFDARLALKLQETQTKGRWEARFSLAAQAADAQP